MRTYMAYRVTLHGLPIYPEYIFRNKSELLRFIDKMDLKTEDYVIQQVNLDVPKYGLSLNDFRLQQLSVEDLKSVSITFKDKSGVLHNFKDTEAINIIKNLKEKSK